MLEILKNTLQAKGDFETLLSNVNTMIDEIKNQSS
jgi:hypothetical protein